MIYTQSPDHFRSGNSREKAGKNQSTKGFCYRSEMVGRKLAISSASADNSFFGFANLSGSPCLVKHFDASSFILTTDSCFDSSRLPWILVSIRRAVSTVLSHAMGFTSAG